MQYLVGVDIGGTHIRTCITSFENMNKETIIKLKERTLKTDESALSRQIIRMIRSLLSQNMIQVTELVSINIATAGPLDVKTGVIFNNANLGHRTIRIKGPIKQAFPSVECNMINDANGAVLGVHFYEATDDEKDNLVYITMSTGIGAGVIVNGHLLRGKDGNAAEAGHGMINPISPVECSCGASGCWESFSAGSGLSKQISAVGKKWTTKELYENARKGNTMAQKIVDQANFYNTVGIGLINNFYDPEAIYIGGAITNDADLILPVILENFEKQTIKFTINRVPSIKLTKLGDEIGLLGALALGKYILDKDKILL
ncbi:MAG: ROK family protein [Candidatus Lokiarchaeota archaeon]|nr:ROK family protein [Candidatus Lokiarchaeota archaeon]